MLSLRGFKAVVKQWHTSRGMGVKLACSLRFPIGTNRVLTTEAQKSHIGLIFCVCNKVVRFFFVRVSFD